MMSNAVFVLDTDRTPLKPVHFVYALTVKGQDCPFYIGKATYKTRPYAHLTLARRGEKSLKSSIIRKADRLGLSIVVDVLFSTNEELEAFAKECELIASLGRRGIDKGGILANRTVGGEGRCGNHLSEEQKRKLSIALSGRFRSRAHCVALSLARKGHIVSPETRKKLAEANTGKKHTAEHRAKVRQHLIGRPVSLETRQKMSAKAKGRTIRENQRQQIREALMGRQRPEDAVNKSAKTTREKAAQHIRAQQQSGLSQKQYCEQHDIKEQTFCGWKRSPYVQCRLQTSA